MNMNNIFKFIPEYLECDMHRIFSSTEYVYSIDLPEVLVQHHITHGVSCLAENKVIGWPMMGLGMVQMKKIWGERIFNMQL